MCSSTTGAPARAAASICAASGSMNSETRMPPAASRAAGVRDRAPAAPRRRGRPRSSPPSRFSGTRQASCGCTSSAIASISAVAAISRFMRVCSARAQRAHVAVLDVPAVLAQVQRDAVGARTAPRRSAASSGSGERPPRAWRSVATWSMLTPSRIFRPVHPSRPRRRMASITSRLARPRPSRQCAITAP